MGLLWQKASTKTTTTPTPVLTDYLSVPLIPPNDQIHSLRLDLPPSLSKSWNSLSSRTHTPQNQDSCSGLKKLEKCLSPSSKNATPSLRRPLTTSVIGLDRDASSSSIPTVHSLLLLLLLHYYPSVMVVLRSVLLSFRIEFRHSGQVFSSSGSFSGEVRSHGSGLLPHSSRTHREGESEVRSGVL